MLQLQHSLLFYGLQSRVFLSEQLLEPGSQCFTVPRVDCVTITASCVQAGDGEQDYGFPVLQVWQRRSDFVGMRFVGECSSFIETLLTPG
ncbi:MAG: hypothetical protein JWO91_410 [Acidobacteriaceae bacterium]|jgi:hypothetical protein|nr:hypothetical protein [Acidobacteriaceae bacterium]